MRYSMKYVTYFLLTLILGCASPQNRYSGPYQGNNYTNNMEVQMNEFQDWIKSSKIQVEQGTMKNSDRFVQAYNRVNNLPNFPVRHLILTFYSEMIPLARQFESGALSSDSFYDLLRIKESSLRASIKNTQMQQAQSAAIQQMNAQRDLQDISNQLLNMGKPTPLTPAPSMPQQINCDSYARGNRVQTNCY